MRSIITHLTLQRDYLDVPPEASSNCFSSRGWGAAVTTTKLPCFPAYRRHFISSLFGAACPRRAFENEISRLKGDDVGRYGEKRSACRARARARCRSFDRLVRKSSERRVCILMISPGGQIRLHFAHLTLRREIPEKDICTAHVPRRHKSHLPRLYAYGARVRARG